MDQLLAVLFGFNKLNCKDHSARLPPLVPSLLWYLDSKASSPPPSFEGLFASSSSTVETHQRLALFAHQTPVVMAVIRRSCVCQGGESACEFGFLFDHTAWWADGDRLVDDGSSSSLSQSSSCELKSPKLHALFDQADMLKPDGKTAALSQAPGGRKGANGRNRRGTMKQKRAAKSKSPPPVAPRDPASTPVPTVKASPVVKASPTVEPPAAQATALAPPVTDTVNAVASQRARPSPESDILSKKSHEVNNAEESPPLELILARFVKTPKERTKRMTFVSMVRHRRNHLPPAKVCGAKTRATYRNNSHIAAHKIVKAANKPAAWPGKKKNVKREVACKFARFRYWVSDKLQRS